MSNSALKLAQTMRDGGQLADFAARLARWLHDDLNKGQTDAPTLTPSRARALLRATNLLDDPSEQDFARLMAQPTAVQIALYDLLRETRLAESADAAGLAVASSQRAGDTAVTIEWLPLIIAAYAWHKEYPLYQLDPSSPPEADSPAGQLLRRAATFLRRQLQRSATERDKLVRQLSQPPGGAPSLEEMAGGEPIAPLPPHFRPPIPVRYPEVARETVSISPDEETSPATAVTRAEPIRITEADLTPARAEPLTIQPQEEVTPRPRRQQPPSPMPPTAVVMPNSAVEPRPGFTLAVRQMLGQEEMKSAKLHVLAQEYPDGPGLYGLQVRVTCKGIKSYVAGTTDRDGRFTCELPVRLHAGLTYDVDVTWPREMNNEVERKSITLNADRTAFTLPFYRSLNASDG
jgi:hypothetical protein